MLISLSLLLPHLLLYIFALKHNSYYVLIFNSVFLVLMTGQAIFIETQLQYSTSVQILHEYPTSKEGFILALLLYSIILYIIVFSLYTIFMTRKTNKHIVLKNQKTKINIKYSYLISFISLITMYYLYIIGGPNELFHSVRPSMVNGATFPLSLLLSSSIVFSAKFFYKNRLNLIDVLLILYIISFLSLSGSRVLIIYFLAVLLFSFTISYKKELNSKYILFFFFMTFLILIVGQALKQFQTNSEGIDFFEIITSVIKLFYLVATEGFAGFSGYITYGLNHGFTCNFGIDALSGFLHFIPGQIRNIFGNLNVFLASFYRYRYSIVSPGLQNFFVYFSFVTLIIYPLIFIYLTILENNYKNKNIGFWKFYFLIVFLVQSLTLIRGTTEFFIYYTGVHILLGSFWYFIFIKKTEIKYENIS